MTARTSRIMRISSVKTFSKCTSRFGSTFKNRAAGVGDHVERELAPFERPPILDDFHVKARAGKRRDQPVVRIRAHRRKRQAALLGGRTFPSRSRPTGVVSAAATTLSAPNAAASFSSLPTPFCGETKTHFSGMRDRLAQRLDRRIGVVRFRRHQRDVGVVRARTSRASAARTSLRADESSKFAEIVADRALTDDVDFQCVRASRAGRTETARAARRFGQFVDRLEARRATRARSRSARCDRRGASTNGSEPRLAKNTQTCPR